MYKSWLLSRYKAIDVSSKLILPSITEPTYLRFGFTFAVRYNTDHPGFDFNLDLILWAFEFQFYDTRHKED